MTAHTAWRLATLAALATVLTTSAVAGVSATADASQRTVRLEKATPSAAVASFTWQLDQLRADATGAVVETNYDFTDESRRSPVTLNACGSSAPGGIRTFQWSFSNGDPTLTTTSCLATWQRPLSEAYTSTQVTLVATPVFGQPATVTHTIRYQDRVIASLGDSAASGEGAPQSGSPALWAARYCGRSGWAASAQAALRIQRSLQDTTIHFWHLACAGATITAADSRPWWDRDHNGPLYFGGMLDLYYGVYSDQTNPAIPAQIDRLQQLQQQTGLAVDRLLITLGANDTHWATVTEDCLNPLHRLTPHQQQVCLQGYAPRVDQSVALLPSHFDALAQALARNPGWQGGVWINEYFDPLDSLSGPQTPFCGGEVFASQYLRNWAIAHVENPLQDDVQKAASRYGWHFVGGIRHAFQGHGVCWLDPNRRWVNSATDSLIAQGDLDGTWHANKTGQLVMASTMYNAIASHLGTPADDGELVSYQGAIFRIAGGAPVYVSNWAAVGGPQPSRTLDSAGWAELNQYPADGTLVSGAGAVFRFAGGAPVYVSNWAAIGGPQPAVQVDSYTLEHGDGAWPFDHTHTYPADGTLVSGAGAVFRFAGGAPVYVSNWAAIGGPQPAVQVDSYTLEHGDGAWPFDHTHTYPADGTLVSGAGAVFRFAGGAPVYVSNWAAIGGPQPAVQVDSYTLEHGDGAWPFDHTHTYPADGTLVSGAGAVFRFAGGAPVYVSNWAAIGGPQPAVQVDSYTLEHGDGAWPFDHTHTYPADGTLVSGAGAVFRFAGGAPVYVSNWAAIGGPQPAVQVDSYTLEHGDGAWPFDHTHTYPADGTFVVTAAGHAVPVRPAAPP